MSMPGFWIFNLRGVASDFLLSGADRGLVSLPTRLAPIGSHDESEHTARTATRQLRKRGLYIRFAVAHPDRDLNVDPASSEGRAQHAGLTHRQFIVRGASADRFVMPNNRFIAFLRHCTAVQHSIEERTNLFGMCRAAEAD